MSSRPKVSFVTEGRKLPYNDSHIIIDQAYVQYIPPTAASRGQDDDLPILFIHGGGLTGSMWESTPDRRPGWALVAARAPSCRPVYLMDTADSGRSQRCPDERRAALSEYRTAAELWQRFRFGPLDGYNEDDPAASRPFTDSQFPLEAFRSLNAVQSARRRGFEQNASDVEAIRDVVAEVGECDIVSHSHGCSLALVALNDDTTRRRIRKFVMVEPATPIDKHVLDPGVESLIIWCDYTKFHTMWEPIQAHYANFNRKVEVWSLPTMGISGNSHFPMHDRNSDQIMEMILRWLNQRCR